ncbi:MAG: HisA/HisF-related TIM barrel protein [Firmicutes bacterium]|nr:HisA/HisF-related TIM barrel protein [Bacillota bacterium]
MLRARIIPCLDVRHGRTVKGVQFQNVEDAGDPVSLGLRYAEDGADELVWLDIVATVEDTAVQVEQIGRLRAGLKIPLTVGGGVRTLSDMEALLYHGADKVSINSAALANPALIEEGAKRWGSQCVVVAVDARLVSGEYQVFSHGGRQAAGRELGAWLREAESRGAGEFLLTSIDHDGRQAGYDLSMLDYARSVTQRPIIASGGAGTIEHLAQAFDRGHTTVLLASLLHRGQLTVGTIKATLAQRGYPIRLVDRRVRAAEGGQGEYRS